MNQVANEKDVYYCFRLLLGREPDSAGKEHWMQRVQQENMTINSLVRGFMNSTEFKRLNVNPKYAFGSGEQTIVDLGNFKMYIPTDDYIIGQSIVTTSKYEPHVTSFITKTLRPDMVFIDVGANLGYFSLLAASIIKAKGQVFAFEPSQNNYNYLLLNAELNGFSNVDVYPFAVAERKSCFEYLMDGSNGAIEEVEYTIEVLKNKVLVRSVTLDETLKNIDRLDVMKVDTEGSEFRVLSGGLELIRKHHPIIFSEFSPPMLKLRSKVPGKEYLEKLIGEKYKISIIEGVDQLIECGKDIAKIMKIFGNKKSTHIDLIAHPD